MCDRLLIGAMMASYAAVVVGGALGVALILGELWHLWGAWLIAAPPACYAVGVVTVRIFQRGER